MSRDNFYIILSSSDAAQYAETNNQGRFITKLAEPLAVQGEWEVALTEIHLPSTWKHITSDQCIFTVQTGTHVPAVTERKIDIESDRLTHLNIEYGGNVPF